MTAGASCGAARRSLVSVQGDVNPCSFLGSAFDAGNIRERSFEEIWRAGHAFRRLRSTESGDRFSGGCRARAQFYAGSAFAEDPWQAQHATAAPRARAGSRS